MLFRDVEAFELGNKKFLQAKYKLERERLRQICSSNWKTVTSTHSAGIFALDIDKTEGK
jgi:hypothetical protein